MQTVWPWYLIAIGLGIVLAMYMLPVHATEVEYHRFGNTVYGSDGSETRVFGGATYTRKDGHEVVCREFGGRVTCKDN